MLYNEPTVVNMARLQAATVDGTPVVGNHDRAAVAVVLREREHGPEVLLIRRAEREGDPWSGHMGLPGGRWEPPDASLVDTAQRETCEEVGLNLQSEGTLLGALPTIPAVARGLRTKLTITPYVFSCAGNTPLVLNGEVDEAWWVPIVTLLDDTTHTTVPYELDGRPLNLPAWRVEGHLVWGLTHAMLSSLLDRLR